MGEPREGDFPDPIYVKTATVDLFTNQIGKAGDYLRTSDNSDDEWVVINTSNTPDNHVIKFGPIAQLQHDVSSGPIILTSKASVFTLGSWFYGKTLTLLESNTFVFLIRKGNEFGFANFAPPVAPISISTVGVDKHVVITTTSGHEVRLGNEVLLTGQAPTNYSGTFLVVATSVTTFTIVNTAASGVVTAVGNYFLLANVKGAHAQFVKMVGDTAYQTNTGRIGEIGIFSMLSGGIRQA